MCGVAGRRDFGAPSPADLVDRMCQALRHRGPDAQGTWREEGVELGHRRLSILDLSPNGGQPMLSASGRYMVTYNGEVYNFPELRARLPGPWRGTSDSEVLLAACDEWGVEGALPYLVGMFALAVWDRETHTLWLVRDRMGKKPLYFGWAGRTLQFASELRPLTLHPEFSPTLDRGSLALYLRYGYVPAPATLYAGVRKLRPGHLAEVRADGTVHERAWWSLAEHVAAPPWQGSPATAVDELHSLLRESVRQRLVSDVPLGAFLSGGIDSSLAVALAQEASAQPLRTFCVGFADASWDESPHALRVAQHLGTRHETLTVTQAEAQALVPHLAEICDEPLADSSLIPTHLVSRLARRSVTVALSGDGGDELFLGYPRQRWSLNVWRWLQRVPGPLKPWLARFVRAVPLPDRRWQRLAQLLPMTAFHQLYRSSLSQWQDPGEVLREGGEPPTLMDSPLPGPPWSQLHRADLALYLADDILVKVDRASMAVGLEARAPLLDHRVVEWALRAPPEWKLAHPEGKWLLRRVLNRYLPEELYERPKQGFGIPVDAWLRGALREWVEDLLREVGPQGLLRPEPIRRVWDGVLAGTERHSYRLWNILSLQAWLARMPWA